MKQQGKFIVMTPDEFRSFLVNTNISRIISHVQNHHTLIPSYRNFDGNNHFEKLRSMEAFHIQRGFNEIGQHFTTFPDGAIATGRSLEKTPACIKGHNTGGICIEHLGNFDTGKDTMTPEQQATVITLNALLCFKFNLAPGINTIVYHHWFRLGNGFRDGGKADNDHKKGNR